MIFPLFYVKLYIAKETLNYDMWIEILNYKHLCNIFEVALATNYKARGDKAAQVILGWKGFQRAYDVNSFRGSRNNNTRQRVIFLGIHNNNLRRVV